MINPLLRKRKERIMDSNKYPKKNMMEKGYIIEIETKKRLAKGISLYFKDITLHNKCFEDFEKEIGGNRNYRIYLECARDNLTLIRIIEPFPKIEIGYTLEEFKKIIEEEKEKKKSTLQNTKND